MKQIRCVNRALFLAVLCACQASPQSPASESPAAALTIQGGTPSPLILTMAELSQMPHTSLSAPGKDGVAVAYTGVALKAILTRAGAPLGSKLRGKALSGYVLATARDGYQVVFSLGELDETFGNLAVWVVDGQEGKPLAGDQGPLRLLCPDEKAPARGVRMLQSLQLVQLRN